nr:hypothetical protein [Desulfobacter hydrogenophilus]
MNITDQRTVERLVFCEFKGHRHMALGRQIVHLIGLHLLQNANEVGGIADILPRLKLLGFQHGTKKVVV